MAGGNTAPSFSTSKGMFASEGELGVPVFGKLGIWNHRERSSIDAGEQRTGIPIITLNIVTMVKTHPVVSTRVDGDFRTRQSCMLVRRPVG